jgi:maltose O-acetyltransferase
MIGPRAMVLTSTHAVGGPGRRGGDSEYRPVTIGDGCWIGAGAIVLPGTTVAEGCVIAAGAVVASDTAPQGLYAGTPARRLRDLDE